MSYRDTTPATRYGAHWQDWANLLLGIWLFLSPWILQFGGAPGGAASWNAWVLGVLVFLVSLFAVNRGESWPEWVNVILGAWVFFSPWIYSFAGTLMRASWNHWIAGAAIFILALWKTSAANTAGPRAHA